MSWARGEEVDPWHLGHVVVDDEQGHGYALVGESAQRRQSRGGRRLADDAEVPAEPPGEIVLERGYHADVVIDREQNGL
jgi:hypothetical protein